VLLGLAAGVLGLALTGTAQAHGGYHGPVPYRAERPYYVQYGHRFSGGYCYVGRDHHHWTRRVYDATCRRYQYWDPYLRCYYYWYPADNCYYPVTYVPCR
jgi:hypothetical protein